MQGHPEAIADELSELRGHERANSLAAAALSLAELVKPAESRAGSAASCASTFMLSASVPVKNTFIPIEARNPLVSLAK